MISISGSALMDLESIRKKAHYLEVINAFASRLLQLETVHDAVWAVAVHAVGKLGFEDCVVYLVNEDETLFQVAAYGDKNPVEFDIHDPIVLQIGEGVCGAVAKSGKAEIISDTSKDKRYRVDDKRRLSEITVPIISNGKVIGIIDSEHSERNYFTQQDLDILTTIASMVSVKIDQALAHQKIERHKDELEKRVEESTAELRVTIGKLQASNEQILRKNIEKETLLQEIHHRVKNNLQIVSSLLNMHANRASTKAESEVFMDCRNRIKAMAVIHEQLYKQEDLTQIDAKLYVQEIARRILLTYRATSRISLDLNLSQLYFSIETSVPFGLILNELMVNAMKYAYPVQEGVIRIELLESDKDEILLVVLDNGPGFDIQKPWNTMGLELIETLTCQLDGTVEYDTSPKGTRCNVRFPKK